MDTDKLSGIVVYTIHDNDSLRNALREALKEKLQAEELDESTYGIPIAGDMRNTIKLKLESICKEVEKDQNCPFSFKDTIRLYWPTYPEESGKERFIKQVQIELI